MTTTKLMRKKMPKPKTPLPESNTFADRLWWLMQVHGDTVAIVSKVCHVSFRTISVYLNGHENPKVKVVLALADYYNVTTDFLLGRTRTPN